MFIVYGVLRKSRWQGQNFQGQGQKLLGNKTCPIFFGKIAVIFWNPGNFWNAPKHDEGSENDLPNQLESVTFTS